jgi:hypothetical protein
MTANPFPEWLPEVAADAVRIDPADISAEARGNQWSFSLTPEEAAAVSVADVTPAADFREIAAAWLGSPYLHGIPWTALRPPAPGEEAVEPPPPDLPVWSLRLP